MLLTQKRYPEWSSSCPLSSPCYNCDIWIPASRCLLNPYWLRGLFKIGNISLE